MNLSHVYYVFTLVAVYYSIGQIINWNPNTIKMYFPPNLEILPSGQGKWNSHAYYVFTLVVVHLFLWTKINRDLNSAKIKLNRISISRHGSDWPVKLNTISINQHGCGWQVKHDFVQVWLAFDLMPWHFLGPVTSSRRNSRRNPAKSRGTSSVKFVWPSRVWYT